MSDKVKFVYSTLKDLTENTPNKETKETLKKHLPKILKTAQKTKEWGLNFMTGEIDIFEEETEEETEDI